MHTSTHEIQSAKLWEDTQIAFLMDSVFDLRCQETVRHTQDPSAEQATSSTTMIATKPHKDELPLQMQIYSEYEESKRAKSGRYDEHAFPCHDTANGKGKGHMSAQYRNPRRPSTAYGKGGKSAR